MTHNKEDAQKLAELHSAFTALNDRGKDSALTILRTLRFAQSVIGAGPYEVREKTNSQHPACAG